MTPEPRIEIRGRAFVAAGEAVSAAAIESGDTWDIATDAVTAALAGYENADLAVVFIDSRFHEHYADVLARLQDTLRPGQVIGCSGQSVIGPGREAEDAAAISVLVLRMPGCVLTPFTMIPERASTHDLDALVGATATSVLIFAEPYSVNTEHLIAAIEERRPGLTLLGGMASAHDGARGTAVFLDGRVYKEGAVMLALGGTAEVRAVVAQGAEPIGEPWTITDCERNLIRTIGNRPAIEVLRETIEALDDDTRERASRNLLVGLAIDEYRAAYGRGDYLIRNLLGYDQETGAIAVSANVRVGQTVQFQFRDASAADEDLREQLARLPGTLAPGEQVVGALLCTCNGRGVGLFGTPDHDARAINDALAGLPTAGLFCNGEIGPVAGKTFLHGFTASVGFFTTRTFPAEPVA
jgi:small ligand-binding sensory domain FIST